MNISAQLEDLRAPLHDGELSLEPLGEQHRNGLAAACAADRDIWAIYSRDWSPAGFKANFDAVCVDPSRHTFAVVLDGIVVGMTGFIDADTTAPEVVEIGGTYMAPYTRGTGLNTRVKRLLIARAAACGFHRIELRIDTRNARSMAAAEKLGAVRESILHRHRVTWTGYLRDTAIYVLFPNKADRVAP